MSYKLIQTRSPFFIKYDTVNETVTMNLKIWTGNITGNLPASDSYTLSKEASSGASTFEIAELVRDFIYHTSVTSTGYVWVQATVGDGIGADVVHTFIAAEGYILTSEGIQHAANQSLVDGCLLPVDSDGSYRMTVNKGEGAVIPVIVQPTNVNDWSYSIDSGARQQILAATSSSTIIRYISVPNDTSVVDFDLDGVTFRVYIDTLGCNKYDSNKLLYLNKLGAKVYFPFNLKFADNISSKSTGYTRSLVNYSTLSDYSGLHTKVKSIRETKQMISLNTDWMSEYYVKQIEELLLSEYVWLQKAVGNAQPVNITTSKMLKKNHLNDKLINYTVEVEAASEYIQTTR